jgi:hypothetical protein
MTSPCRCFSHTVVLSVVISLLASPVAAAQAPPAASPVVAPDRTVRLGASSFARLLQEPRPAADRLLVGADTPRPGLLRQAIATATRQAQATPTQNPGAPQRSWASRHKVAMAVLVGLGVTVIIFTAAIRTEGFQ